MPEETSIIDQCPAGVRELFSLARDARERSYSPYSRVKVGAAIRLADGSIFTGCNVENASYGGSVCAERVAILKAVSERADVTVEEIVVVTDFRTPWPPCGLCLQVIAEFGPDCTVHLANLEGLVVSLPFRDLMPHLVPLTGWSPERP